jgi:hypothetical protein
MAFCAVSVQVVRKLNAVAEAVFRGLVIARVVEPTSNAMTASPNSVRVLADLGADAVS